LYFFLVFTAVRCYA